MNLSTSTTNVNFDTLKGQIVTLLGSTTDPDKLQKINALLTGNHTVTNEKQNYTMYTQEDAAKELGISRTQVWRLTNSGKLRMASCGRQKRIPASELERFSKNFVKKVKNNE
jgi:excisionase family DNA binding protein